MELQVLKAAGRLSEVVGSRAIGLDREFRRMGMGYGAELALKEMGFERCWLVMQSPYDEMIGNGAAQKTELPMPIAAAG